MPVSNLRHFDLSTWFSITWQLPVTALTSERQTEGCDRELLYRNTCIVDEGNKYSWLLPFLFFSTDVSLELQSSYKRGITSPHAKDDVIERWDVGFSAVLLCIVSVQGGLILDLLVFK